MRTSCKICIVVILMFSIVINQQYCLAHDSELHWIQQVSYIMEELEHIEGTRMPMEIKEKRYSHLVKQIKELEKAERKVQFSAVARKTVGYLLETCVYQKLALDQEAVEAERHYKELLKTLPTSEKLIVRELIGKRLQNQKTLMKRVCRIQSNKENGKQKIKVEVVNTDFRTVVRKLEEITAIKIELTHDLIHLVDYRSQDWETPEKALRNIGYPDNIHITKRDGKILRVTPLWRQKWYESSLAGLAQKYKRIITPEIPEVGISSGYVFIGGNYVSPPYKLEVSEVDEGWDLSINGISVRQYRVWKPPSPREWEGLPKDGQFEDEKKRDKYVFRKYGELRNKYGVEGAVTMIAKFLESQKTIAKVEYDVDREEIEVWEKGDEHGEGILLSSARSMPNNKEEGEKMRKQIRDRVRLEVKRDYQQARQTLGKGGVVAWGGSAGMVRVEDNVDQLLTRMCMIMRQTRRQARKLRVLLYGSGDYPYGNMFPVWQFFVNLTHRDLIRRLEQESQLDMNDH